MTSCESRATDARRGCSGCASRPHQVFAGRPGLASQHVQRRTFAESDIQFVLFAQTLNKLLSLLLLFFVVSSNTRFVLIRPPSPRRCRACANNNPVTDGDRG